MSLLAALWWDEMDIGSAISFILLLSDRQKKSKWLLPGKKLLCWLHRIGLNKSFLISNSSRQQQKQSVCLRNIWSALWSSKSYIYRVEWFDWSPDNPFSLEEKWGKKILFLLHCIWRHDKRKSAFSTKYMELLPISSCKPNHSADMVCYTIYPLKLFMWIRL